MVLSETNTTYDILDPRVAVSSNGLAHVVCWKEGGPNAIYYATFRSDGNEDIGWTALASGTTSGQRKMPNIEIDGSGRVHIAWYDAIDHPGTSNVGHREIYYTRLVYAAGHVANSIDRARLTTTVEGYSPEYYDAPEMAVDTAGSLHLAWPDKTSATTSNGIRYLRLDDNGTVAVASMVAFDGSVSSPGPRAGRNQAIAVQPGGGARIVCTARAGISSPYRLWQVDVSAAGTAGTPLCITDSGGRTASTAEDAFASLGTDSRGVMHLVYAADSGVPLQQATQQRVTYRDFAADPASNDVTRGDLEIDAAHVVHASTPAPPRQNTPVIVQAEIRNAGWAPMLGGTATLWFEGAPVDVEAIPGLSVEETCAVPLHWTVPDDATRTPAALRVSVAPLAETPQTSSANDSAAVPMSFQIPPTATALIVEVLDETYDEYRAGKYIVPTSTVTLSGTTADGRPYTTTGERVSYRTEFYGVPLGTYTVSHAAPGYIISSPASRAVSITRDPGDRYRLITTPSTHLQLWANRWGTIEGAVTESGGATPVVGVELTLLETGATTTTPPGGLFRYDHLCEGPVTMKVKKVGYERQVIATDVVAATTLDLDVSLVPTTTGYLVGTVTDDGGYAVSGATMKVSRTGFPEQTFSLPDGRFDVRLPGTVSGLTYNLAFSAPGYLPNNDVTAKVVAGEEVDPGAGLALDVRSLTHTKGPERWVAPWTMKANWFGGGFDSGGVELESFDIMQWYGLFRFTFDADYQRAGLDDYIRYVKPKFVGEMFSWTYLWGVDPPNAPKVFKYEQDLAGLYDDRFQPPMLNPKATANRTGVRIDGLDIIDQRTGTVVANVRSSWNSCDSPDGHLYGTEEGGTAGDGQFRYGSVPFDQQVVRLWITVGQMNADGHFEGATFGDIGRFNQGELLQATGYNQLQLFWRPADDYLWVEPALVGYPNP
jgi:hypothetical protein